MKVAAVSVLALAALAPAAAAPGQIELGLPIACELGRTCEIQHYVDRDTGPGVRDYRCGLHSYDRHDGIDFRIPDMAAQRRGVTVLAAAAGKVVATRDGAPDISVSAPGAPSVAKVECGNGVLIDHGDGWRTQYCHMARGSVAVKRDDAVAAGAPLGRVGLSGNTEFPHLHFRVLRHGRVVDPFAPDAQAPCGPQAGLWRREVAASATYRAGAVLNAGFADGPVTMDQVEAGGVRGFTAASPTLVAYVRAIALMPGDVIELELRDPAGKVLARSRAEPLQRWRAQSLVFVGDRRPAGGWPNGVYVADYRVLRQGKAALSRRIQVRLPR